MLTVDEITATVEQRRASTITFDESSDEEAIDVPPMIDPGLVPQNEHEEGSEADEEDLTSEEEETSEDEESELEEDDSDTEEDEQGKAFTSTGCEWAARSCRSR
jgi:mitogen-activated protein kinase kinase kinase